MQAEHVPAVLRDQLGADGTTALLQVLARAHNEERPGVVAAVMERFERRVAEEGASLRALWSGDLAQTRAAMRGEMSSMRTELRQEIAHASVQIRQDMSRMESTLRADISKIESGIRADTATMESAIRGDMSRMESAIRRDMSQMESVIRQDIAGGRVDLVKWSFVFWIGQVLALASLFAVMIRMRP